MEAGIPKLTVSFGFKQMFYFNLDLSGAANLETWNNLKSSL